MLEVVLQDLESLKNVKLQEQKDLLNKHKLEEIKNLLEQYNNKLEDCLNNEDLINDAVKLREKIFQKEKEL
jgi:hypothetical protein